MTYEYLCESCKHKWEQEQKISSPAETVCPKCGKDTAKRLISGGLGFQLVGGGWAKDSYK